jgi:hypothetical protein
LALHQLLRPQLPLLLHSSRCLALHRQLPWGTLLLQHKLWP